MAFSQTDAQEIRMSRMILSVVEGPTTMTIQQFFSKDYLFNPSTPSESRLYLPLLILFGLLFVLSLVLKLAPNKNFKKVADRYSVSFLTTGILGLIYLFCRYEGLPWLGTRLFLLLVVSILFIWTAINLIWIAKYIPEYKTEKNVSDRYGKYLPKSPHVAEAMRGKKKRNKNL